MLAGRRASLGDPHRGVQDAARGDAGEEALLARERAQPAHRLFVAHEQLAVEQREVEDLGRVAVLERAQAVDALAGQRLGGDDLEVGPVAAQAAGAAHERAARAEPGDEDVDLGAARARISSAVPRSCASGFAALPYWNGMKSVGIGRGQLPRQQHGAVRALSSAGEKITSAPNSRISCSRSGVEPAGITIVTSKPRMRPCIASAMPVLPLEGSRMRRPGQSSPAAAGGVEHRAGHAVLDGARRVEPLELREQAHARRGREPRQLDERRVADRAAQKIRAWRDGHHALRLRMPPAIAGSTITLAPAASGVSSPPLTRTSSPST